MMYRAYSVYDRKGLIYAPPFFAINHGTAIRMITDTVADMSTSLARHPNDYVLYCIGIYDDQSGNFAPSAPLEHVIDVIATISAGRQAELFMDGERDK